MELILTTALTLFIVLDPFGNLAVFNTVLSNCPAEKRQRILLREQLIALFVLMAFLVCGQPLLDFLDLKQSTLRMSGGLILFLVALGMVFPTKSVLGGEDDEDPWIVPLAIPLVAGPSSLILVMLLARQFADKIDQMAAAIFVAWLLSALILWASPFFLKFLGKKGLRALERLMGMLLVMISMQMFLDGLTEFQRLLG